MWLRRLWNWFKVREVLVAVPVGFEVPQDGNLGADPRFLREMAESMKKAPVVYEYMNDMLKKRRAYLETPPPTTTQTERDAMKWKKDQAAIEAALLTHLLYSPATSAQVLNALANRKKEVQAERDNWTLERYEP
jgi:hypothetical protein